MARLLRLLKSFLCSLYKQTFRVDQCIYFVYTLSMETKVQKWGNSLGVRLPKEIADQQKLTAGSQVLVSADGDRVILSVVKPTKPNLKDMLNAITPDNLHQETEWGKPIGKEVW